MKKNHFTFSKLEHDCHFVPVIISKLWSIIVPQLEFISVKYS